MRSSRLRLSSDKPRAVFGEIGDQGGPVGVAAFLVAEGVQFQDRVVGDFQRLQDVPAAGDDLGVRQRFGGADEFGADLVKLAVAALLRALVAEHRAGVEDLLRQRLSQPVGHQRPADAGGAFGPEGDGFAAAVVEGVHLLHHDVGGFAQGAGEDAGVLEDRGYPFVEAVGGGDTAGGVHDTVEAALFLADEVVGAAGGLQVGQRGVLGACAGLYIGRRGGKLLGWLRDAR